MKIADAFDVRRESLALRHTFVSTREMGFDWTVMAVLCTRRGRVPVTLDLPSSGAMTAALCTSITEERADRLVLAQDAWLNVIGPEGPGPDYLRPCDDPLASESFVLSFVTADDFVIEFNHYRMDGGMVVWTEKTTSGEADTWSRAALPLQRAFQSNEAS
jgi:hypothetical protein